MIKTFTQEDLIRYIYNEAPAALHEQIEQAICFDEELAQQYTELAKAKQSVDKLSRQPGAGAIANILAYSRNYSSKVAS
jgi:hypothetical protein